MDVLFQSHETEASKSGGKTKQNTAKKKKKSSQSKKLFNVLSTEPGSKNTPSIAFSMQDFLFNLKKKVLVFLSLY